MNRVHRGEDGDSGRHKEVEMNEGKERNINGGRKEMGMDKGEVDKRGTEEM